jgi:hypothetical protein
LAIELFRLIFVQSGAESRPDLNQALGHAPTPSSAGLRQLRNCNHSSVITVVVNGVKTVSRRLGFL